jgi:hypothetical protein
VELHEDRILVDGNWAALVRGRRSTRNGGDGPHVFQPCILYESFSRGVVDSLVVVFETWDERYPALWSMDSLIWRLDRRMDKFEWAAEIFFEEELALERLQLDDRLPFLAYALSEKQIAHWQLAENAFQQLGKTESFVAGRHCAFVVGKWLLLKCVGWV